MTDPAQRGWSEEEIKSRYLERGVVQGSSLLLSLPVAREFVSDCEKYDLAVLGVEQFILGPDNILEMGYIGDFSPSRLPPANTWEQYARTVNELAKKFLRSMTPRRGLVFEFFVWTREEWESRNEER